MERSQQVARIDIGVVTDEHGERLFVEGVGTGLFASRHCARA